MQCSGCINDNDDGGGNMSQVSIGSHFVNSTYKHGSHNRRMDYDILLGTHRMVAVVVMIVSGQQSMSE